MERLISGAEKLGLQLNPEQLEQFNTYYQELVGWNRRINLTAITDYEEIQVRAFLDSLTVVLAWQPPSDDEPTRVLDVGSGGGMPGVPLKIAFPGIRLVLLEATKKKVNFLKHLSDRLALDNVQVLTGRAEEVAREDDYRETFDLVLSRAVAKLATLAELALPFCTVGGMFVAHKKGNVDWEIIRAEPAIITMGGKLREVKSVDLPEFTDRRLLVVIDKVKPTPDKYPRRPGMPEKRPLV